MKISTAFGRAQRLLHASTSQSINHDEQGHEVNEHISIGFEPPMPTWATLGMIAEISSQHHGC
jgi:hypothetical protein